MKSGLNLIFIVILFWFPFGWAQAAKLTTTRTGEHGVFTRIVFEFKGVVRSKKPIITGRGKFYVVFPGSTQARPRRLLDKTTRGVRAVRFIQKKSFLSASITLSFPYFRLKTFYLSNPDRVVIDAYRMSSPPEEIVPKESPHAEPIASVLIGPTQRKQAPGTKKSSVAVMKRQFKIESKGSQKSTPDTTRGQKEKTSDEIANQAESPTKVSETLGQKTDQVSGKQDKSTPFFTKNYNVYTYVLVFLNIFTVIIVALLGFNLLKRRSRNDSEHLGEMLNFLKTTDESVATIDTMIKRELKKLNRNSER